MKHVSSVPCLFLSGAALAISSLAYAATPALVWSDEFAQPEGTAPDPAKWNYDLGGGGWGNNELEVYTNARANSRVIADPAASDGKALLISAVRDSAGNYTSARLKTQGKFSVTYGRIEARLKTTNGQGLWPAFWMLGESIATVGWPRCGEIDIMEVVNRDPKIVYGTLHGPGYSGANGIGSRATLAQGALSDAYHVYAVDWSPGKIVWSFDGAVFHTVTPASLPAGAAWVFDGAPLFLLLNLAVGGNFPGNPDGSATFPQNYTIDYVRVYARAPAPPVQTGAIPSGPSAISLSWSAPTDTDGVPLNAYRLDRASDPSFTANVVHFDVGPSTSYVDTTAVAGSTYFYRVAAVTSHGVSDAVVFAPVRTPAALATGGNKFSNISTRAFCGPGRNAVIAGFVIPPTTSKRVLIRVVGPTLTRFGLEPADVLADPTLELHAAAQGNAIVALNDNWSDNDNAAELVATAARVGATPLATDDTASATLLLTLPPGAYTCVAQGKNQSAGVVLIEIYDADAPASSAIASRPEPEAG